MRQFEHVPTVYVLAGKVVRKFCLPPIPMLTPILLYKSGMLGGINHTDMLS